MRNFIETIKAMGLKGVVDWLKRLFLYVSLIEFISYSVYWLVSIGAISKLTLIMIPVIGVVVASIDDLLTKKENEEIEDDEEEEEEEN